MAPKTIYYPPIGVDKDKTVIQLCLNYDDSLTIEFTDPGKFSDSNQSAFTDPIPTGKFGPNNVIGPYDPNPVDSYVELKYKDDADKETYKYEVTIQQTPCPPSP